MKVFIGGSIGINYLDRAVKDELDKHMNGELEILIGDAYGIDSLVQKYLNEQDYVNVTIYASNGRVRNNIGGWRIKSIKVPSGVYGRDFYTYKDVAMTAACDFALMVWNGKSQGTLNNILRLINNNKGVNVYLSEKRQMKSVNCYEDYKKLSEEL